MELMKMRDENHELPESALRILVEKGILGYFSSRQDIERVVLCGESENVQLIKGEISLRNGGGSGYFNTGHPFGCDYNPVLEEGVEDGVWYLDVDRLIHLYKVGCGHKG